MACRKLLITLGSTRDGEFGFDDYFNVNATRMWSFPDKTLLHFISQHGPPQQPSAMLMFNERLTELPGVEKLREGRLMSACDGIHSFNRSWNCEPIERIAATSINFMSLDPVLNTFIPGDVNRDWQVGFDDLLEVAENYGNQPQFITDLGDPLSYDNAPPVTVTEGLIIGGLTRERAGTPAGITSNRWINLLGNINREFNDVEIVSTDTLTDEFFLASTF